MCWRDDMQPASYWNRWNATNRPERGPCICSDPFKIDPACPWVGTPSHAERKPALDSPPAPAKGTGNEV
jgi:hypothetical protein